MSDDGDDNVVCLDTYREASKETWRACRMECWHCGAAAIGVVPSSMKGAAECHLCGYFACVIVDELDDICEDD